MRYVLRGNAAMKCSDLALKGPEWRGEIVTHSAMYLPFAISLSINELTKLTNNASIYLKRQGTVRAPPVPSYFSHIAEARYRFSLIWRKSAHG